MTVKSFVDDLSLFAVVLFRLDADAEHELRLDIFNLSLPFCTALSISSSTVELIDESKDSFRAAFVFMGLGMIGDGVADAVSSAIGAGSNFVDIINSFTGVTDFFGRILLWDPCCSLG